MTKQKPTTTRTEIATRFPVLLAAFSALAAATVLADDTIDEAAGDAAAEQPAPDIADSSSGRDPAVTTFPHYPARARRDRIEGNATVCFKIAPDGRILEPSVTSSTHEIFEGPALEAIRASSFEPLAPGDELVPTPVCRTYRFRLDPVTDPRSATSNV